MPGDEVALVPQKDEESFPLEVSDCLREIGKWVMKHDRKDTCLSVKKSANKILKRQLKDAKGHIEALKAEISSLHSEMGDLEYRCNELVLRNRELERLNHELDMELDKYSIRVEPMNSSKVKEL